MKSQTIHKTAVTLRYAGIGVFLVGTSSFATPHSLAGQGLDSVVNLLKEDYRDCVNYIYERMDEAGYARAIGDKMQTSFMVRIACLEMP